MVPREPKMETVSSDTVSITVYADEPSPDIFTAGLNGLTTLQNVTSSVPDSFPWP